MSRNDEHARGRGVRDRMQRKLQDDGVPASTARRLATESTERAVREHRRAEKERGNS